MILHLRLQSCISNVVQASCVFTSNVIHKAATDQIGYYCLKSREIIFTSTIFYELHVLLCLTVYKNILNPIYKVARINFSTLSINTSAALVNALAVLYIHFNN